MSGTLATPGGISDPALIQYVVITMPSDPTHRILHLSCLTGFGSAR